MKTPRLRGHDDLLQILLIVAVVATISWFLLGHLRTRRELFSVARERSFSAYQVRDLEEQQRHLRLEERIREASVRREEAPAPYQPASAARTVLIPAPVLPSAESTPWEEESGE